ncbi:MAG TPA: COX15/CtaA family protein [Candidatus Sulfotelmatobacter sp.]|nr:COX15/CtaA family protein [Candidatus Sulfotelmatobacter sp.]
MFRAFSLAGAALAFLLAVLGSWVRINGAGMTCPDWPLCHGQLIPSLAGGVVFEWSHRLVAFVVGWVVLATLYLAWRERDRIAGLRAAVAFVAGVFVLQVALGGLTVFLSNSPWSVVVHWAAAMLLLAGLTVLAILATVAPRRIVVQHSFLGGLLTVCALLVLATMCAGAYVSSSGAGLACSTLPLCDGGSLTGTGAAQHAQMVHRVFAGALFLVATVAAYLAAATTPRVRTATLFAYALIVLQVMLGFANVAWDLPMVLREAHAANASATFIAFITALGFAAFDGTVPVRVRARTPVRASSANAPNAAGAGQ